MDISATCFSRPTQGDDMSDTITCSGCHRPTSRCSGDDLCEAAKKGAANPYPPEELVPYQGPGKGLFSDRPSPDYRAEALSRDPTLVSSVERMSGSFRLAYVIRNDFGRQLSQSPREDCAWAGASGATQNSRYAEWRERP